MPTGEEWLPAPPPTAERPVKPYLGQAYCDWFMACATAIDSDSNGVRSKVVAKNVPLPPRLHALGHRRRAADSSTPLGKT